MRGRSEVTQRLGLGGRTAIGDAAFAGDPSKFALHSGEGSAIEDGYCDKRASNKQVTDLSGYPDRRIDEVGDQKRKAERSFRQCR